LRRLAVLVALALAFIIAQPAHGEERASIGLDPAVYAAIFADGYVSPLERRYLYQTYYEPLPAQITASATLRGGDIQAIGELLQYGLWIREQMKRGYVLIGSGMYGYHDELETSLAPFIKSSYRYKDPYDTLLAKLNSPLYFYFADRGKPGRPEPVPVSYAQLNARQKRVYDITDRQPYKMQAAYFMNITAQSEMGPAAALQSGRYIGVVSGKSVNDFGRRFLLYKDNHFVGVVIVGGEAKRDDWTGLGSPTSPTFSFKQFPLCIRETNGQHWAFDLPQSIYEYFGGTGGPVTGVYAVDPDK